MWVKVQFWFLGMKKAGTIVILNPLQRVKNPYHRVNQLTALGFFALRISAAGSRSAYASLTPASASTSTKHE